MDQVADMASKTSDYLTASESPLNFHALKSANSALRPPREEPGRARSRLTPLAPGEPVGFNPSTHRQPLINTGPRAAAVGPVGSPWNAGLRILDLEVVAVGDLGRSLPEIFWSKGRSIEPEIGRLPSLANHAGQGRLARGSQLAYGAGQIGYRR